MTDSTGRPTILVVTARMGGGHDGAARELARRVEAAGYRAPIFDMLSGMRMGYGQLITGFYHAQLRYAMWSYQAIYHLWRTRPGLVATANHTNTRMARHGLLAAVERHHPVAVVSTYNLASQVLGELTRAGDLHVPIFTFITDFGVHPYWIHDEMSGYFTVHEVTAAAVQTMSDAPTLVIGPLVALAFTPTKARREATRDSLGIGPGEIMALVVAGAWGIGNIDKTAADLDHVGHSVPVVVCGNNHRLARRLRRHARRPTHVLDFVDTMPELMDAADVLVENAGGLTAMEAFASDLPVITYRPIPAHGTDNARAMSAAGVTRLADDRDALAELLPALSTDGPARRGLTNAGRRVFRPDAVETILTAMDPHRVTDTYVSADEGRTE